MTLANTARSYGTVAKSFHWMTALMILTLIPLGIIANGMAHDIRDPSIAVDEAFVARTVLLFSLHKTLGVALFFVALARIGWALGQTKPGALHPDRRAETLLAETVHWLLYGSLLLVPLTGWIGHAATSGFAPIWWPFGQSLPFVAKSADLAHTFSALHIIFERVLALSILLHVAGALKHAFVDRDMTLRRMLFGSDAALPTPPAAPPAALGGHGRAAPVAAALMAWCLALAVGTFLGLFAGQAPAAVTATLPAETPANSGAAPKTGTDIWTVTEGTIGLTVQQFGSVVTGSFAAFSADITFDPDAPPAEKGAVMVTIDIGSLTLGSVTDQALGPDFFHMAEFPVASFAAQIEEDDGLLARGTLTLRGLEVPVEMPFTLQIAEGVARMSGKTTLDRRAFGIGDGIGDAATLGFEVVATVELTAERGATQ